MRKSNYIAAAMAFAALVGCQKELVPVSSSEQADSADLAQRPVLANTTLTIGGAETRVALDGYSWKWEANDKVGAVLTDQIVTGKVTLYVYVENEDGDGQYISAEWSYEDYLKGTKVYSDGNTYAFADALTAVGEEEYVPATSQVFYKITDKQVWTNYRYNREGSNFSTEARLVEGHYMFYAPYNAGNGTRGPLVATLPVDQDASTSTQAVENFYNGETPAILSLEYLSADGTTSVKSDLEHIYAYPEFTIYNNFNGYIFKTSNTSEVKSTYTMQLKQIEFYTTSTDLLAYKRAIKPSKLINAENWHADFLLKDEKLAYTSSVTSVAEAVAPAFTDTEDDANWMRFEVDANKNPLKNAVKKVSQRIVVDLGGKELKNGEKYSFHAILPAENYTDGGLYARILVTIAGTDYYILTNEVANNKYNKSAKLTGITENASTRKATVSNKFVDAGDYQFADRHQRGSDDIVLVRGQRYPAAEVAVDPVTRAKSIKTFVKENGNHSELLMIELVGGTAQVAVAAATPETPAPPTVYNGIENNKQLIDSILANVFTSGGVEEVAYGTDTKGDHSKFYFNPEKNETIINAELIQALATHLGAKNATFTLTETNLPIAAGVQVEKKNVPGYDGTVYTFTAGEYSYDIQYAKGFEFGPNKDGELVAGINIVNGNDVELKMAKNETNAVVFVNGDATVKTPAGINSIKVESGRLTINSNTDVATQIEAADVVLVKGNLVNELNVLGTVENNNLQTIKGETNVVTYVTKAGFDTNAIAAATQVNYVTVFVSKSNTVLRVTPTSFGFIKNLKNVTVLFDSNVAGLVSGMESVNGITLTNIKQMKASAAILWKSDAEFYGVINVTCDEDADLEDPFYVNITEGDAGINFGEATYGQQAFDASQLQNQLEGGNAKLGSDITTTETINLNGGELDGQGHTLTVEGSVNGIQATSGTIKDLTINGGSKALSALGLTGDLYLEGVTCNGKVYGLNASGNYNLEAQGCEFYGWSSWKVNPDAKFVDCIFGSNGSYNDIALYDNTTFENCDFAKGLTWNLDKEGGVIRFDTFTKKITLKNCTVGGVKITGTEGFFTGFTRVGQTNEYKNAYFSVWLEPEQRENSGAKVSIKDFFVIED